MEDQTPYLCPKCGQKDNAIKKLKDALKVIQIWASVKPPDYAANLRDIAKKAEEALKGGD